MWETFTAKQVKFVTYIVHKEKKSQIKCTKAQLENFSVPCIWVRKFLSQFFLGISMTCFHGWSQFILDRVTPDYTEETNNSDTRQNQFGVLFVFLAVCNIIFLWLYFKSHSSHLTRWPVTLWVQTRQNTVHLKRPKIIIFSTTFALTISIKKKRKKIIPNNCRQIGQSYRTKGIFYLAAFL